MTDKEKVNFYKDMLISMHTLNWTGNHKKLGEVLKVIGNFSYKHTNTNAGDEYEPEKYFDQLVLDYENIWKEERTIPYVPKEDREKLYEGGTD